LKAHTLGNIAMFGDSYENGIFSKISTFGGLPKGLRAQRSRNLLTVASVSTGLKDDFVTPGGPPPSSSRQWNPSARSYVTPSSYTPATFDLFDADNPATGGEADSTLVGAPLSSYSQWDAGNPASRSDSETRGRQTAYSAYKSAWQTANSGSSGFGAGPASAAYFGSDPAFVRKEGGTMNSVTTFGDATGSGENGEATHSHTTQYFAGSGGTVLMLLAGYFALKWTRRI
jgi:hypothetical protein